jgi:hypothetical protein
MQMQECMKAAIVEANKAKQLGQVRMPLNEQNNYTPTNNNK